MNLISGRKLAGLGLAAAAGAPAVTVSLVRAPRRDLAAASSRSEAAVVGRADSNGETFLDDLPCVASPRAGYDGP